MLDAVAKQDIIKKISLILEHETAKPYKEMNIETVEECVDCLLEIRGIEVKHTDKEVNAAVDRIMQIGYGKQITVKKTLTVLFVAVISLLLFISLMIMTMSSSGTQSKQEFEEEISLVNELAPGETLILGDREIHWGPGGIEEYRSFKKLLADTGLKCTVLKPAKFPKNKKVLFCSYCPAIEGIKEETLSFSDKNHKYSFYVNLNQELIPINYTFHGAGTIVTVGEFTCYITSCDVLDEALAGFQCAFTDGRHTYIIMADNLEEITEIIENLEVFSNEN